MNNVPVEYSTSLHYTHMYCSVLNPLVLYNSTLALIWTVQWCTVLSCNSITLYHCTSLSCTLVHTTILLCITLYTHTHTLCHNSQHWNRCYVYKAIRECCVWTPRHRMGLLCGTPTTQRRTHSWKQSVRTPRSRGSGRGSGRRSGRGSGRGSGYQYGYCEGHIKCTPRGRGGRGWTGEEGTTLKKPSIT